MKEIQYYRKNVYGNTQYYIADPETARLVTRLTGKKTIDADNMAVLDQLGFATFKEILAP